MFVESDLPTHADIAEQWFVPADVIKRNEDHVKHIGSLIGLPPKDPFVQEMVSRLHGEDRDEGFATWLVGQTFIKAEAEFAQAFDPQTGVKTHAEYLRWSESVFRLRGEDENREPDEEKPEPQSAAEFEGDLDNFKQVNDELGRNIGDLVLEEAAREISSTVRIGDKLIIYRKNTKGDEFGICYVGISYPQAQAIWRRLQEAQANKISKDRREQIWQAVKAAKASCPDPESYKRYVEVKVTTTQIDEGLEVSHRNLYINDRMICALKELAVIDFGFGHGLVKDRESLNAIVAVASAHQDRVKKSTHKKTGEYRKRET